jgi:hypothetical protein
MLTAGAADSVLIAALGRQAVADVPADRCAMEAAPTTPRDISVRPSG